MGGDFGPRVIVPALVASLRKHSGVSALLFGDQQKLAAEISPVKILLFSPVFMCGTARPSSLVDDKPSTVLRHKRDSTMGLAVKAVAEGDAKACISAGNTGALMALGLVFLKTLPGISRPAICTTFPTSQGRSYMLDLGANLECSPQQLHQFALLGSLTAQALDGIVEPTVRLVNVGEEAGKGGQSMAETAALLSGDPLLNYRGYVEGDGIFEGSTDVVVCDGFTGNVALKTSEGLATMINGMFKALLRGSWTARIGAIFMRSLLLGLKSRLDPALYNGAYLLGLNGVVVEKSRWRLRKSLWSRLGCGHRGGKT